MNRVWQGRTEIRVKQCYCNATCTKNSSSSSLIDCVSRSGPYFSLSAHQINCI